MRTQVLSFVVVWSCLCSGVGFALEPRDVERYLVEGKLADGEKALSEWLEEHPQDGTARFGLGVTQFVRGLERLGQSLYRFGLEPDSGWMQIPVLRLPVGHNPKPEPMKYEDARQVLLDWLADLQTAEKTLAAIKDDNVKLPLKVSDIRWDWDGDGEAEVRLSVLVRRFFGQNAPADLSVTFDRGDVAWLRGYCHLLMFFCEFPLAHDGRELFDVAAHVFFKNAQTTGGKLRSPSLATNGQLFNEEVIVDLIAFIHMIRLPIKEPERMKSCWEHLRAVIETGRESWKFIRAETDDEKEWIPNGQQTSVLGLKVPDEMIDTWLEFLDECDDLLQGKRLVPFWRKRVTHGVNLKRVFLEPRDFDLVLWIQGTAAAPYFEDGPKTRPEVWQRLQRVFRGEFIGFALWFN